MGRAAKTEEAQRIIAALRSRGFNQADLARLAGVTRERVGQVLARQPLRLPASIERALSEILSGRAKSQRPVVGEAVGTLVLKEIGRNFMTALCTRCGRETPVSRVAYRLGTARCSYCSVAVVEDLSGRRIGALTVVGAVAGQRPVMWWVRCDCGALFKAWDHNLRYFRTTKCKKCAMRLRNRRLRARTIVPAIAEDEAKELAARLSAEQAAIAEWEGRAANASGGP